MRFNLHKFKFYPVIKEDNNVAENTQKTIPFLILKE